MKLAALALVTSVLGGGCTKQQVLVGGATLIAGGAVSLAAGSQGSGCEDVFCELIYRSGPSQFHAGLQTAGGLAIASGLVLVIAGTVMHARAVDAAMPDAAQPAPAADEPTASMTEPAPW